MLGAPGTEPEMSREQKREVRLQLPPGHHLPSTPEVSFLKAHHPMCGLYNQPPNWPPSFLVDLTQLFSYNQSFNARVGL